MAKETHIKTDKNPLTAGVLGSYDLSRIPEHPLQCDMRQDDPPMIHVFHPARTPDVGRDYLFSFRILSLFAPTTMRFRFGIVRIDLPPVLGQEDVPVDGIAPGEGPCGRKVKHT